MHAKSIPNSPDFDVPPPPPPPEMGHFGTEWDSYQAFELTDIQFQTTRRIFQSPGMFIPGGKNAKQ